VKRFERYPVLFPRIKRGILKYAIFASVFVALRMGLGGV